MNTKRQGALGVAKAVDYYTDQGYAVFVPVSDVSRFDLVVEKDGLLKRVEVKTTSATKGEVMLRTRGGNQSWSGESKRISPTDCDEVFCYNVNSKNFAIYSSVELEGRNSVTLH